MIFYALQNARKCRIQIKQKIKDSIKAKIPQGRDMKNFKNFCESHFVKEMMCNDKRCVF